MPEKKSSQNHLTGSRGGGFAWSETEAAATLRANYLQCSELWLCFPNMQEGERSSTLPSMVRQLGKGSTGNHRRDWLPASNRPLQHLQRAIASSHSHVWATGTLGIPDTGRQSGSHHRPQFPRGSHQQCRMGRIAVRDLGNAKDGTWPTITEQLKKTSIFCRLA